MKTIFSENISKVIDPALALLEAHPDPGTLNAENTRALIHQINDLFPRVIFRDSSANLVRIMLKEDDITSGSIEIRRDSDSDGPSLSIPVSCTKINPRKYQFEYDDSATRYVASITLSL